MSYILDALRKAEQERERSRVPGLSPRQKFSNAVNRIQLRYGLVAAGALALGTGVMWLWSGPDTALQVQAAVAAEEASPAPGGGKADAEHERQSTQKSMPGEHSVALPVPSANAPPKSIKVEPVADPAPLVVASGDRGAAPPASLSTPPPQPKSTAIADAVMPAGKTHDEPQLQGESGSGDVVAMIAAEAERGWPVLAGESAQPAAHSDPVPHTEAAVVPSQQPEPAVELPPLLSTLPYRFQSTLPKIVINAQAYADAVEERFVIINMKKYREGERTQEGIVVEGIGKELLLLSYQGQLFRLQR